MSDLSLFWEEILRYARTHQVEEKDVVLAGAAGFLVLLVIAFASRRREDKGDVRDRWVLVALEPGSSTDNLVAAFKKRAWDIQLLPSGVGLGEFLTGFHPSLLVVDQMKYGNELTRLEATEARVASTPILFMDANQVDRTAVPMRAWLPGNAKIKLILEQAEKLVRSSPSPQQLSRKTEVQGPLDAGTLLELLYFQANTQRTGRMEISCEDLSGWIWIKRGEIRHAVTGRSEGTKALHILLDLFEGQFSFVADVEPPTTTIHDPTVFLLHEYARQRDERGKMAGN